MNDKAVCRTALATPGLLKMGLLSALLISVTHILHHGPQVIVMLSLTYVLILVREGYDTKKATLYS